MGKHRVTHHSARTHKNGQAFSPKHNDRNYDYESAYNIHEELTHGNKYYNIYQGLYSHEEKEDKLSFEDAERLYYESAFTNQWEQTNERYKRNGHSERCKSFEDWRSMKENLPEELCIQIGKKGASADADTLRVVLNDYLKSLNEWNKAHGSPFAILDYALHVDEEVAHFQMRRVWQYTEDGVLKVGQNKALEQAGVQLPDETKKRSRHNNRKQTFDREMRDMLLDICEKHNVPIERVPLPDGKHNLEKEEYISQKYQDMLDKTSEMQNECDTLQKRSEAFKRDLKARNDDLEAREREIALKGENLAQERARFDAACQQRTAQLNSRERDLDIREFQLDERASMLDDEVSVRAKALAEEMISKRNRRIGVEQTERDILSQRRQVTKTNEFG